ncbi:MAG: hypothetical protein NZ660_13745 [Oscillatoriaceae bacterium SKYG93]|nr:hypothetical protein [Oscillatoriaceae bacterium SKYG93]MDW8454505.1 hypothetical protein [Oscillatoriaceae cyanobacterium SKYGB_i_bin93]
MYPRPCTGNIRPKFSTMPRQKTEASAYLDLYKLALEKKRLQQDLQNIEKRRQQILKRLALLEVQIAEQERDAQQLREAPPVVTNLPIQPISSQSANFNTIFLEY